MIDFRNETSDPVDEDDLVRLAEFALRHQGLHADTELSLVCVGPDEIAVLHEEYLDEPGPTDVMSFPMDEMRPGQPEPGVLGDVVLCPRVAAGQAAAAGHTAAHELRVLLAHGILHLLGFDHVEPDEESRMFALQREIVARYEAAE